MGLAGEADKQSDATPWEGNPFYHLVGYVADFEDETGGRRFPAGTDSVGIYCYELLDVADKAYCKNMQSLPVDGRWGLAQDYGEHSVAGCDKGDAQMEAWSCSGCSGDVEGYSCHTDP